MKGRKGLGREGLHEKVCSIKVQEKE